tara:strand:- start:1293 stop:1835 length:543 start_codon:yes stop_codon:yes gene_type:complete
MSRKTINKRKKQSNKKRGKKSKKSKYSSIANKIDKAIDSHFKKTKKTKKTKSGQGRGPWARGRNPRIQLMMDKKDLDEIEQDIQENTEPLIKKSTQLEFIASKQTKIVASFIEEKILNDINESLRILKDDDSRENKINFLHKALLFWKMCEKYPKTKTCLGKNHKEKINEYMEKLKELKN